MLENWMFRIALNKQIGKILWFLKPYAAFIRSLEQKIKLRYNTSSNKSILVFALPKSGSTWLEELLSVYFGLTKYMPSTLIQHELLYKESSSAILSPKILPNIDLPYITKSHVFPSKTLIEELKDFKRVVILKRNLNDVIQSHYRYVNNTPFHPDHKFITKLQFIEAINWIEYKYVPLWKEWVNQWEKIASEKGYYVVDYIDLKNETVDTFKNVINSLGDELDQNEIKKVVEYCSSNNMKSRAIQKNFFR